MRINAYVLFVFCLLLSNTLQGQIEQTTDYTQKYGGGSQQQTDSLIAVADLTQDTFNFHFFYPDNMDKEYPYQDTTLERFQNHDPARQQDWDYATLGNLGAAAYPYVYQPVQRGGFEVGFRQFDLYKTTYDEFAFYRLRKAFTRLHFTQGKTQQDTYTQAIFSRNFSKGINLTMDFKRMNHTGQYLSQKSENTSFSIGLWYKSPSQRYDAFISFVSNAIFQQENGGIDILSITNVTNIDQAISVPLQLSTGVANTAHTERAFHYHQRFLFNKQRAPKRKAPVVAPYLLPLDSTNIQIDSISGDTIYNNVIATDSVFIDSLNLSTPIPIIERDTVTVLKKVIPRDTVVTNISEPKPTPGDTLVNNVITNDSIVNDSIPLDSLGVPIPPLPVLQDSSGNAPIVYQAPTTPFRKRKRDYAFSHHGIFQVSKYKFSDTSPAVDSIYYGDLQVDNRGLRYFIRDRKLENIFTLNTTKVVKKGGASAIKKQKDFFEVGLRHSIHFLHQQPRDTIINNLFLQGRWNLAPTERLKIETYADFGLLDNRGDYHMHADLFFDLKNAGQVKARAMHQSFSPTLMEFQHLLSQQAIWKNNFNKTFETSLSLSYGLPRFKLELIGQYHLLTNFIYFNAAANPEQEGSPVSIGQLTVRKNFQLGSFHLDNRITLQQISQNIIRLPELYSWHSLYYEGRIFKKVLNVQAGVDLRINTPYEAPGYQPAIGQFYLESYEEDDDEPYTYPDIDIFVNFKVKTFRFFVKQENLLGYFTEDFNYQIKDYGMPYAYLRFGVSWQFLD